MCNEVKNKVMTNEKWLWLQRFILNIWKSVCHGQSSLNKLQSDIRSYLNNLNKCALYRNWPNYKHLLWISRQRKCSQSKLTKVRQILMQDCWLYWADPHLKIQMLIGSKFDFIFSNINMKYLWLHLQKATINQSFLGKFEII